MAAAGARGERRQGQRERRERRASRKKTQTGAHLVLVTRREHTEEIAEHSHISFVFVNHKHKFVICDLRPLRCGNAKYYQINATGENVPSTKNATGEDVPSWPHFKYDVAWALRLLHSSSCTRTVRVPRPTTHIIRGTIQEGVHEQSLCRGSSTSFKEWIVYDSLHKSRWVETGKMHRQLF
jgi:hypothetical protein